jgi:hypothetical protein
MGAAVFVGSGRTNSQVEGDENAKCDSNGKTKEGQAPDSLIPATVILVDYGEGGEEEIQLSYL